MRKIVERAPRQLLAIGLILLIGVGYSIYRAAEAFSPQDPVPEYQRSPSPAFAIPDTVSIVDPTAVNTPRLPDDAYQQIIPKAQALTEDVADRSLTSGVLMRLGMDERNANQSIGRLNYYYGQIEQIENRDADPSKDLSFSNISPDGASVGSTIEYPAPPIVNESDSIPPPVTMSLDYQFVRKGAEWRLQGMTIEL